MNCELYLFSPGTNALLLLLRASTTCLIRL